MIILLNYSKSRFFSFIWSKSNDLFIFSTGFTSL